MTEEQTNTTEETVEETEESTETDETPAIIDASKVVTDTTSETEAPAEDLTGLPHVSAFDSIKMHSH